MRKHLTGACPRAVKVKRDLHSVQIFLANDLPCDAVRFYTVLIEVAQDSQTAGWCFSARAGRGACVGAL